MNKHVLRKRCNVIIKYLKVEAQYKRKRGEKG